MEFQAYASGSAGNLYTATENGSTVLIECGLPIKKVRSALGFSLASIDFCLLTHAHNDHSRAVKDVMKAGVDVYTSQGTIDALGVTGHRVHAVQAGKQFQVGGWIVLPVPAQHDAPEPLAFLLVSPTGDRLLFATDTYYLRHTFKGLNIIAVECNYADDLLTPNAVIPEVVTRRLLTSHFSLANVKGFLGANDLSAVREIWLLHLSDLHSDEARFAAEVEDFTGIKTIIAEKGGTT